MASPFGPWSVPMSRACTMAALRADRSASSAPSCTNSSRSLARSLSEKSASDLNTFSATGRFQMMCIAL